MSLQLLPIAVYIWDQLQRIQVFYQLAIRAAVFLPTFTDLWFDVGFKKVQKHHPGSISSHDRAPFMCLFNNMKSLSEARWMFFCHSVDKGDGATTKAWGLMNLHSITAESDRLLSRRNELSFLYLWDHSPSINCSLSRLFITGKSG